MSRAVNRRPNTRCVVCGTATYKRPYILKTGKGLFCRTGCRNRVHRNVGPRPGTRRLFGPDNPAWRGGIKSLRTKGNYYEGQYIRAPEWAASMARKDGYVYEHRLIMAMMCGRLLTSVEVVHHVDHNPRNNAPENLELWPTNASHKKAEWNKIPTGAANLWLIAA